MKTNLEAIILGIAAIIDYGIGDPEEWWHPVQGIGCAISRLSNVAIITSQRKWQRHWWGIILGLGIILGSGTTSWIIIYLAKNIHFLLGIVVQSILLASCFAARSLWFAAEAVLSSLVKGNIVVARAQLSQYVGRNTDNLSEEEILRAILEMVSENAVDGVTSPLFYAIVGAFFPGIGLVPFAFGYKAVSTLDSMIGYQKDPFKDLGWFSAKLEDYLTWLPCRLTVLTLALISGKPLAVLSICRRDAPHDPSPNSGWSECVYAAILGVQLGGTNTYQSELKHKPLLGDFLHPITPTIIYQALQLTQICFLLWLGLGIVGLFCLTNSTFS
ncbi:MAG: cobalamin biosynthesis protein [cyanobacterium endosymbiont of Rhopalodia gibba]